MNHNPRSSRIGCAISRAGQALELTHPHAVRRAARHFSVQLHQQLIDELLEVIHPGSLAHLTGIRTGFAREKPMNSTRAGRGLAEGFRYGATRAIANGTGERWRGRRGLFPVYGIAYGASRRTARTMTMSKWQHEFLRHLIGDFALDHSDKRPSRAPSRVESGAAVTVGGGRASRTAGASLALPADAASGATSPVRDAACTSPLALFND
jgi:hypothetical protein